MRDDNNHVQEVDSIELTDEELSTVSGGAIYMNYGSIKGDATEGGFERWIQF